MASAKTVYVIDDDAALCAAYSEALKKRGYVTKIAHDGVEGQNLIDEEVPAAILLDMLMPNLGGKAFLHNLRNHPATEGVCVIVVSNFEPPADMTEYRIAKFLSKMQSPPDAVAAAVDQLLKA